MNTQVDQTPVPMTAIHQRALTYSLMTWLIVIGASFIVYPLIAITYDNFGFVRDSIRNIKDNYIIIAVFKRSILIAKLSDADMNVILLSISAIFVMSVLSLVINIVDMLKRYNKLRVGAFGNTTTMSIVLFSFSLIGAFEIMAPLPHSAVYAVSATSAPYMIVVKTSLIITFLFAIMRSAMSLIFYRSL